MTPTPVTGERITRAAAAAGITLNEIDNQWVTTINTVTVAVTRLSDATLLIRAGVPLPEATGEDWLKESIPHYMAANAVNNALPGVKTVIIAPPDEQPQAGMEVEIFIGEGLTDSQLEHNLQRGFAGVITAVNRFQDNQAPTS